MSLDLEKLRKKLEDLKNPKLKTSKFDKKTWSPDATKTKVIRFISQPGVEDPFSEMWFHYNLTKFGFLCPRLMSELECPACNFGFSLFKTKDATDKDTGKKLMPKQRFYALVLDREDATQTPKWWGFGVEIYRELLEAFQNAEYSNFMNIEDGIDAEVRVVSKTGKTTYNAPKLTFKRKESKLAATQEEIDTILSKIPPLSEVFKPITESEIDVILQGWTNMSETDGTETVKEPEGDKHETSTEDYSDLEKKFEALQDD
jgi:hypothetical protein